MRYTEDQKRLITAARLGDLQEIQALVAQGYDVDCELKYGSSAVMIAASRGNEEVVVELLKAGSKANRRNRFGATALMEASDKGRVSTVRTLISYGAEVNLLHNNGTTVLMAATQRRDMKMIRVLLELGADPSIENFDGWSPRKWAMSDSNKSLMAIFGLTKNTDQQALNGTDAEEVKTDEVKVSTIQVANDPYWTAFMRAATSGDNGSVRRLAEEGVEINGQSPNGTTALIAAVKNGQETTVTELIELGADLNLSDGDGVTPLAWAARKGQMLIVNKLKAKGASDSENETLSVSAKAENAFQPGPK